MPPSLPFIRLVHRNLRKYRFKIGLSITIAILVLSLISQYIAPYPREGLGYVPVGEENRRLLHPSPQHLFGTDTLGRDLFSRVIMASRSAIIQAFSVVFLSLIIGLIVGVLAAYFKGLVELVLNYLTELFMAIPSIVIALFFRLTLEAGFHVVIISLVTTWWAWYARITYVYAKGVVELDYVVLAKLSGLSSAKIIMRHVVGVIIQPILVQAISDLGSALLEASGINFMGLGLPPGYPDWGVILYEGISEMGIMAFTRTPWLVFYPGLFILLTTLGFTLLADPLREDLDPRLRRRWKLWF
ncbi:MAG: ABC transporter permease [Thermosphaera sp.]|nr:ABC transporter permease [Thermosphaera sp.]